MRRIAAFQSHDRSDVRLESSVARPTPRMTGSESGPPETWWFGALCHQCGSFIPVDIDPSGGKSMGHYRSSGTVIVQCRRCGHKGTYRAIQLVQRRTDHRESRPE